MIPFLRRMIVRAAPTCTLWRHSLNEDCLVFRPWPRWKISGLEQLQLGGKEIAHQWLAGVTERENERQLRRQQEMFYSGLANKNPLLDLIRAKGNILK